MTRLSIRTQIIGRRGLSAAPLEIDLDSSATTVRDLLELIVRDQIESFRRRKQDASVLRILTERDLAEGREAGRIATAAQQPDGRLPNPNDAIDAVLTAFEDGFYYMFVNGSQIERLDQPLCPAEVTDILFVRLTPLAGG
jgi:hypothetical protein